ncbi:MAG TPA: Trm112 family protein [Terriglobales bacterium]
MIPQDLLEVLACPVCKKTVVLRPDGESVKCDTCHRVYSSRDGILNMLVEEAVVEPS